MNTQVFNYLYLSLTRYEFLIPIIFGLSFIWFWIGDLFRRTPSNSIVKNSIFVTLIATIVLFVNSTAESAEATLIGPANF